jgi:hypothetical protein
MNETCGCCEGLEPVTPLGEANRPGLDALAYRTGTHATFLETMKARLSATEYSVLRALTTRAETDPSIALLDAWATVADVFTFYQERIANEGYLRTATERRSILELARLVGYVPRPGVAASVYLALTLEEGFRTTIAAGTRAQSLPGPGELPQFFETSEALEARAEWNVLKPRLTRPQFLRPLDSSRDTSHDRIYLKGVATNLEPNDPLLVDFFGVLQDFRRVRTVEPDPERDRTLVTLMPPRAPTEEREKPSQRERLEEISRRVDSLRDLEANNVSPSETSRRVVGLLEELQTRLSPETPPEEILDSLRETVLPGVRENLSTARERNYTRLIPWLDQMESELQEIEGELSAVPQPEPFRASASTIDQPGGGELAGNGSTVNDDAGDGGAGNGKTPSEALEELLGRLGKAPSVQPVNAAKLPRRLEESFGSGSDAVPQLLTALQPDLGRALYRAWEQTGAQPGAARVYALRVKDASPFGHNAPPRAILVNGTIHHYEEWDLKKLPSDSNGNPPSPTLAAGDTSVPTEVANIVSLDAPHKQILPGSWVVLERPYAANLIPETVITRVAEVRDASRADYGISAKGTQVTLPETTPWIAPEDSEEFTVIRGTSVHAESELLELAETPLEVVDDDGAVKVKPVCGGRIELDRLYDGLEPGRWVFVTGEREDLSGVTASELVMLAGVTQIVQVAKTIAGRGTWNTASGVAGSQVLELTISAQLLPDGSATGYASVTGGPTARVVQVVPPSGTRDFWCINVEFPTATERINFYIRDIGDGITSFDQILVAARRGEQQITCASAPDPSEWTTLTKGDFKATETPLDSVHSTLVLANDLAHCYRRESVSIYGNVVNATHGETRPEVLGSGDGSAAFQRFSLKQSPLTYVAATTPSGVESTLEVYVNDIRWHEAEHLSALQPADRRFITQTDDEGEVTVVFGDGQRGARLPTGVENVRTVYRTGIGKAGNVAEGQISLLATRPLALKGVINPQPATGGAARETREEARQNAPLGVKVFDRLVSVRDYEDFARAFAGIGKASSTRLSDGRQQLVHLTIAGVDDIPIAGTSDLYRNLLQALRRFGDPQQPVRVDVRELIVLIISAGVRLLPDYLWEPVEREIRASVLETFSFEHRDLGQDALLSEVISAIQHVPGVSYVDVDTFGGISENLSPSEIEAEITRLVQSQQQPNQRVKADMADSTGSSIRPAQLAFLTPRVPDTLILKEITA